VPADGQHWVSPSRFCPSSAECSASVSQATQGVLEDGLMNYDRASLKQHRPQAQPQ
jgi:hypothetical protein